MGANMKTRILAIIMVLISITSCSRSGTSREVISDVVPRSIEIQNIQIHQSQLLPPYGMKVTAEIASLKLQVSSSQKESSARLQDLQSATVQIKTLASDSKQISLKDIVLGQLGGSNERELPQNQVQFLDTSSISLTLTTSLGEHNNDFMECVIAFNEFINSIKLPETITVEIISVGTELGDAEIHRPRLISRVYEELHAIQQEYGPTAKYEITGLYDGLKMIKLNDIDYYIYIEPVIVVSEF